MRLTVKRNNKEFNVESIKDTTKFSNSCDKCYFNPICSTEKDIFQVVVGDKTYPSINEMCISLTPEDGDYFIKLNEKEFNYILQDDIIKEFCKKDTCPFHKEPLETTCFKLEVCPFKKLFKFKENDK